MKPSPVKLALSVTLSVAIAMSGVVGCQTNRETGVAAGAGGGAAAGAAAGATAGAPFAGVGAVAGAAGGAIVGAIIGSSKDKKDADRQRALEAAQHNPAMASAVIQGGTADLNDDGFVTIDEIVAMQKAGLGDDEILDRCRATQQIFQLNADQEKALLDAGVHQKVVTGLRGMNSGLTSNEVPTNAPAPAR
jgi:hypothetical protein